MAVSEMKGASVKRLLGSWFSRPSPMLLSVIVLLIGGTAAAMLLMHLRQQNFDDRRAALESSADLIANNIHSRLASYELMMHGVKGFFEGSDYISPLEFRNYVEALNLPVGGTVQAVALVKAMSADEKSQYVAEMRKAGLPGYAVRPDGVRRVYAPIVYIEPLHQENLRALGFDVLTVPAARAALERARDGNGIAMTDRLTLVQDTDKPDVPAFVLYLPIYKKGEKVVSLAERQAAITGWVDVPFHLNDLMAGLAGEIDPFVGIDIYEGGQQAASARIFQSSNLSGNQDVGKLLQAMRQISFGGRQWSAVVYATPAFDAHTSPGYWPALVASVIAALTLALAMLIWLLANGRDAARKRYRQLFDMGSDGVVMVSPELHFIDVNPAALRMLDYKRAEFLKLGLTDTLPKHELLRLNSTRARLTSNNTNEGAWDIASRDGKIIPVEISAYRLRDGSFFATLRDLTERNKADQRIRRLTRLYQALSEVNQAIVRMLHEDELFPLVCRCAVEFAGMKLAWIGHVVDSESKIVYATAYGDGGERAKQFCFEIGKDQVRDIATLGDRLRANEPIVINDFVGDAAAVSWRELALEMGWGAGATFPIYRDGKLFAALLIYDAKIGAFDTEAINLFTEMAKDIAFAIENFDREKQRQQLTQDLNSAYRRIMHIINVSPAVVYSLKVAPAEPGGFVVDFVSDTVMGLTGYTSEEWGRSNFWGEHLHPDDRPELLQLYPRLLEQTTVKSQFRIRHADGHYLWVEGQFLLTRDDAGNPTEIAGAWLDITQDKEIEQSLQENEQMLSESQRIARIGSWYIVLSTGAVTWSDETYRIYHVDPKTFSPTREAFFNLIHPEDRTVLEAEIDNCIAGKGHPPFPFRIQLMDGSTRTFETQGELKYDAAQKPFSIQGTVQDVTERVQAEQQLHLNALVFESSREGIFITDADNNIVSVNRAFTEITGYALEDVVGKNSSTLGSGRSDKQLVESIWRAILEHGFWQGEIWNRRKSGETFPVWLSTSVVRDSVGKITQQVGLMTDLSERNAAQERIRFLSNFDPLTGLPNRSLLRDRTHLAIAAAKRASSVLALFYVDLDRFKFINDSLGPSVGDQILKDLSLRLTEHLHSDDTLCHPGGDEFFVLLPNTDADGAAHVAKKLQDIITKPFAIDGQQLTLTASIGIAQFPNDGDTFEMLAQSADAALFRAKHNGRNNFQFFAKHMHDQASEILLVENELRRALVRGEFELHYQPQVDTATLKIIGAEALIRWQHPEKGMIPPAQFIPIAEESGLIIDIGNWVLGAAVRQMAEWLQAGLPIVPVAVNISVVQFRQNTLFQIIAQLLRDHKLDPSMLELEMTEGVAMENIEHTQGVLSQLHDLGVTLSIDDFGTGYSSLSYLKSFKIDKLKIDQSFVRGLGSDLEDEAIVTAIIGMAKGLGFKAVAEGVETSGQLDFLRENKCSELQGYYFSKPLPKEGFAALLRGEGVSWNGPPMP